LILFLLILGTFSTLGGHQTLNSRIPVKTSQAAATRLPILGIDCGLGAKEAVVNGTGFPVSPSENGAFETQSSCTWIGDIGNYTGPADKTTEPLVSDQDETFSTVSPSIGGGFTADIVYLQNGTSTTNGFDVTVSWNPSILRAVTFDQGGTNWAAQSPFTATQSIDNNLGQAHLVQVLFSSFGVNFTFFRIRFDVIGVGSTGLALSNDFIANPGPVVHQVLQGNFDSESFFDPTHTLKWSGGFTISPNPPAPGSPNTFTSTILCSGCTSPLHYQWDFNNDGVTDSVSNPATITIPTPTLFVSRVTLKISDSAFPSPHNSTIVEGIPLTAAIQAPLNLPVNTAAAWNGLWLGGIANYAVAWKFCPGTLINTIVCSKPNPTISSQPGQNNTQTLNGASPGYHFSGVYNVSLKVVDSGSGPVPPSTVLRFAPVNVTGGTPVFSVQVTPQSATVGSPVGVSTSVAYATSYPATSGFRSNLFKYLIYWGDGALSIVNGAGLTASSSHVYLSAATYPIKVVVQDLQTISQITEAGFATVNVPPASGFDYSLSLLPSQGLVGSGGGTTSSHIIVNIVTGTPQTVSLHAISPTPGITVFFNATAGLPPYASTMTVTVSSSIADGAYTIVLIGNTTSNISHQALFLVNVGTTPIPIVSVFSSQYGTANITDTSLVAGSTFQVQVNVSRAPLFNAYEFVLYYDQNYLNATSFDLATGTVFDNPFQAPGSFNGLGALRLAVVNLNNGNNNNGFFPGGSGVLARITFSVVRAGGVSPLVLAAGMAIPSSFAAPPGGLCPSCPAGSPNWTRLIASGTLPNGTSIGERSIQVATSDGYFKNVAGKSGPVASFTFSPASPTQGDTVTFNATSSFDPDSLSSHNHGILEYLWDFGDLSFQANLTSAFPVVTHVFGTGGTSPNFFSGNFSIRLTVIDLDNGFQGMKTIRLTITPPTVHDIGVTITLSSTQVVEGTSLIVTVRVVNLGSTTETFNLTLTYGPPPNATLAHLIGRMIIPGALESFQFVLNTTALLPGVYNIVARVSDLLDTNPSNNVAMSQFVVQVLDEPPTASFTFTPTLPVVFQDVIFNGTNSADPDGTIQIWFWNFGDGFNVQEFGGGVIDHIYISPGTYTVSLMVRDSAGLSASENMTITVSPRPPRDVGLVSVDAYPSTAVSGEQIVLEAGIANTGSNSSTVDLTFYYNGKVAVTQKGVTIPAVPYTYYVQVQWDTTGIPAGNYTLSATVFLQGDPTPADNSLTDGQVTILPPPVLTLTPNSGPVGTLVQVHGSGFPIFLSQQFYPVEVEVTFDNQLEGFFFIQSSSFNFSFDVPDAQPGLHTIHAIILFGFTLDVKAGFTVTPTPTPISVTVSVGSIYFPGDTATIFVLTGINGPPSPVETLQVTLTRPNGTSITLTAVLTATGVYKATYPIPSTAAIGTYAVVVRAHQTGSGDGSALASFEVKQSWLSSNGRNLTTGIAITGLVGVALLAWRKGYFRKNDQEETP
jgi:PKD repeat protein